MFARIVLAYDGSAGAQRALNAAAGLAAEMGSEVVVVSVEDHLPHYGATVGEVDEERAFEQRIAQRCLTEASARLDEAGVKTRTEIRAGHAAQEIVRAATDHAATLIVVGASGHSGVWGRFLGSTTEKVSRHAPCAVLIAR